MARHQMMPAGGFRFLPDVRFLHLEANEERQQRRQAAQKEHRPPAPAVEEEQVTKGGQQVAQRIALLQYAGQHTAQPRRHLLHGQRRAHAPLSAHADAEQRAQDEEAGVGGCEAGGDFDGGVEDKIDHQRQAPPVAISQQAEQKSAHRPKGQRDGDGERNGRIRLVELLGDGGQAEGDQEEVEGVERPSEVAGQQRVAMIARRFNGLRFCGLTPASAHGM